MVYFPESTRFAVIGTSRNLVARAPLNVYTNEQLGAYIRDVQSAFAGKPALSNTILVSGMNPILTIDNQITSYSTLLDNLSSITGFLQGKGFSEKEAWLLGPRTPEGGKNKAKNFSSDGTCSYNAGSEAGNGVDDQYITVPVFTMFDLGMLVETVEELGLGETLASRRGLLERYAGLKGVKGNFHFEKTDDGSFLCINNIPVLGVNYPNQKPNVYILRNNKAIEAVQYALAEVPATLSMGFNQNFGWNILVANFLPLVDLDVAARTPLSMEVEGAAYPLILSIDDLGKQDVHIKTYNQKQGRLVGIPSNLTTTITTMGLYVNAHTPAFWHDIAGKDMPECLKRYSSEGLPFFSNGKDENPVTTVHETFAFFRRYDLASKLERMLTQIDSR